jgi:flagellar biosynthesis/type III secretory pathway protein FliH
VVGHSVQNPVTPKRKERREGGREEGRKEGRKEGREEGRKGGRKEGRKEEKERKNLAWVFKKKKRALLRLGVISPRCK